MKNNIIKVYSKEIDIVEDGKKKTVNLLLSTEIPEDRVFEIEVSLPKSKWQKFLDFIRNLF